MLLLSFATALTDCQNLKQFALGLNMHLTNPTIMNEINTNCCTGYVTGVSCTGGVITEIFWIYLGLNGTITANLPSQLKIINLEGNGINENLPMTGYPPTLTQFYAMYNNLNGTIPNFPDSVDSIHLGFNKLSGFDHLPTNITEIDFNTNQISMPFPSNLPNSLQFMSLSQNQIYGNVTNLPDNLQNLGINQNLLSGTIPKLPSGLKTINAYLNSFTNVTLPFPDTLTSANFYHNQINSILQFPPKIEIFIANFNLWHGNLPQLPPSLTTLNVRFSQLSGDISNVTYFHVQPNSNSQLTEMNLEYNQFTGNMPMLPKNLQSLRLNNNPMNGSIPSLPTSLVDFQLNGLKVTGSVFLNRPSTLYLDSTLIYNLTIQDTSLLTDCTFSNTPMLNNTNVVKLFPFCSHSDLFAYIPPVITGSTEMTAGDNISTLISTNSSKSNSESTTLVDVEIVTSESENVVSKSAQIINTRNIVHLTTLSMTSQTTLSTFKYYSNTTAVFETTKLPIIKFQTKSFQVSFNVPIVIRLLITMFVLAFTMAKSPLRRSTRKAATSFTV
eukprot:NODE_312_length_10013_cov_0.697801.p2 type:complete len:555 gc:universal NODE_312_length_10013_cov_0.697801:748-2412(+)